jgi:hypothetical protein
MTTARDFSKLADMLAEHTAAPEQATKPKVVKVRQAANDNKPVGDVLAWPALERLAHRGDRIRLYALRHWRDLCFPQQIVIADDTSDYEPEAAIEIRPSEAELLGAVGWKVTKRERWYFTNETVNFYDPAPDSAPELRTNRNGDVEARLGSLVFRKGELIEWGRTTRKGTALKPVERSRGAKGGGEKKGRTDSEIWSYLRLQGAVSPLAAQPYQKPMSTEQAIGDCYSPLPREEPSESGKRGRFGVVEARQLLEERGIDGRVRFEDLPFPATRCADGLIGGGQWIGGVKQPKPTASEPAGREFNFVSQFENVDYLRHLRDRLGKHAKVLDMAITDATATDIGIAMGLACAYAAKRGAALIDEAIDKLIEVDETARGDFGSISEKIAA